MELSTDFWMRTDHQELVDTRSIFERDRHLAPINGAISINLKMGDSKVGLFGAS